MKTVKLKDKTFKLFIPESELFERIQKVADRLNSDMKDKNPLLLAVLNGSFMFAAEVIGINEDLTDRTVVIVEDIVESGLTVKRMIESLGTRNPKSVHVCTLFQKPELLKENIKVDYVAIPIPNDFIVGYGLDYDQQGRQLRDVYTLVSEE